MKSYEDLDVYQRSFALLKPVHKLVLTFPDYEKYDLAQQMRRACKSVPALIAEGWSRNRSPKEFCSFLAQSRGSSTEMEVHFKIARELEYVLIDDFNLYVGEYQIVGKQLTKLIEYWRQKGGEARNH